MATLKEVIEAMPGYVNATDPSDAAVLAYLYELDTFERVVPYVDFVVWASENQIFHKLGEEMKLIELGTSSLTTGQQNDVRAIWALLHAGGFDIDLSKPGIRTMFNSIAGGVVLSNSNRATLFALSDFQDERWKKADEWRYDAPSPGDVISERTS